MTTFYLTPKSTYLKKFLHTYDFQAMAIVISLPIFRDPTSTQTRMKWVYVPRFLLGDPNTMVKSDWTKKEYLTQGEPIGSLLMNFVIGML